MHGLPSDALHSVKTYLLEFQKSTCSKFEIIDGNGSFREDVWVREGGGGGITKILSDGQVFSKAGVNFSHVYGEQLPPSATLQRPELAGRHFSALGVSMVLHANNPFVPTAHANVRFFIAEKEGEEPVWWFGGGFDLTPYYPFEEDCKHFHQCAYDACKPYGESLYPKFKAWADTYFYIKHREEARGIGGLFFDDYRDTSFEHSFQLTQSIGNHFVTAYGPLVEKRKSHPYGEREKAFQLYRRGRYVEFNLVYDRGTLFGLQSGGRTESILMSLPPEVNFVYNWKPEPGSLEEKLYTDFLIPRNWI